MYYTWDAVDGVGLGAVMALVIRRMNDNRQKLLRLSFLLIAIGLLIAGVGYFFGIITRMNPIGAALQWVPWQFGLAGLLGIFLGIGSGKRDGIVAPRILTFFVPISYRPSLFNLLFS